MSDKNELMRYAADAIGSLKAAWLVAITTAGSGGALLFNVVEGLVSLVGVSLSTIRAYWLIRKAKADRLRAVAARERDEYELLVLRTREAERQAKIEGREAHNAPLRRTDDCQTKENPS